MKKELTKQERCKIYKLAYEIHLKDIVFTKRYNHILDGMCHDIRNALKELNLGYYSMYNLPEFVALKPKNKAFDEYWWSIKNTNRTRIKKYKQIINQTK